MSILAGDRPLQLEDAFGGHPGDRRSLTLMIGIGHVAREEG